MKTARNLPLIAATIPGLFAACNYTDGECWYYGEGSENAGVGVGPGGGVLIPTGPAGVGGYGEGPPGPPPGSTPPPECNIVPLSPCEKKCDSEDEARAIECAKIQDEAQRRACIDSSYDKYKSCRVECEKTIARTCRQKWEDCTNFAPFSACASKESGSGGKTRCDLCREDCDAGKSVSSICKKCLF